MTRSNTVIGGLVLLLTALHGCQNPGRKEPGDEVTRWDEVRARIQLQAAKQQFEAGKPEDAIRSAGQALALDKRLIEAYVLLARAQLESGNPWGAYAAVSAARASGVDAPILDYLEGVSCEHRGDAVGALAAYRRARERDPREADYLAAEVELMVVQGAPDAALELLRPRVAGPGADATLDALGARLAVLTGDTELAELGFRSAIRKTASPVLTSDFAIFLMRQRRFAEARALLEPMTALKNGAVLAPHVYSALARCHLAMNDPAAAYRLLQPLVDRAEADVDARLLFATAALASGRPHATLRACQSVLDEQPGNPSALLLRAAAYRRQGNFHAARSSLEAVPPGIPEYAQARTLAATLPDSPPAAGRPETGDSVEIASSSP